MTGWRKDFDVGTLSEPAATPGIFPSMTSDQKFNRLRPLERRILTMRSEGVTIAEVANRIKKSPRFVERVIEWTEIPRSKPPTRRLPTPLESAVLRLRADGESHEAIGERFRKSGRFIRQVEGMAHYREGIRLLSTAANQARTGTGS